MKVCVYGAGAVGGEVAAQIGARHLAEVSVIARGTHLTAIRNNGLTLLSGSEEINFIPVAATGDATTLPLQDLVLVGLKAHDLPAHAERIAALLKPEGCAVFMTNGLPWWWNQGLNTIDGPLPILDPEGKLWELLATRTLGCVVYTADEVISPGVIRHKDVNNWILGEPDGSNSARLRKVADLLASAGLKTSTTQDIRRPLWAKLVRNASVNTVAALTRLTVNELRGSVEYRKILVAIIRETMAVASACGWDMEDEIDVVASTSPTPATEGVRPSMLQDVFAGRPLEIDVLLGQTQAFAQTHGVPTPVIDIVITLLRGLNRAMQQT